MTTIKDIFNRAAKERADGVALRFKQEGSWQTRTYGELLERVRQVSEICAGLGAGPGDRVALYRENSPEWYEIYFGIVSMGATAVPIDITLREQEVAHIFHDCEVSVVFCSAKYAAMISDIEKRLPDLRNAVLVDAEPTGLPESGRVRFHAYETLRQQVSPAAASPARAFDQYDPDPESPVSIIYTSGTTGRQKGAVLSHCNFISNVKSCAKAIDTRQTDNFLLVLPLHHSFAFTGIVLLPVYAQAQVTIVDNLKTIQAAMKETSPTVLMAVPLLLEKMLARILENIRKKKAGRLLYALGLARVIGIKIHRELGGALRLIISGGAPICPETLQAWKRLGFTIAEGYGITETGPVLSVNPPDRPRPGTVGLPVPDVEIKILEPNSDGIGEITARGSNVMQGYYNNPVQTEHCLRDGWYLTGDLGHFDDKGYLVISGRKKSMIVSREGKNIYPEEVEQQVAHSPFILECLALGYHEPGETTGERTGLIAVPDMEAFDALEDREGRRLSEQEIEGTVRAEVKRMVQGLAEYKRPRCIQIRFEEFEKTTTQKIKRYLYAIDTFARRGSTSR